MLYKDNLDITTIVLHHTAVSREDQPFQFNAVNNHHRRKWNSKSELGYYGGYNFFCEPTGERKQYRIIGEETIAQVGNNCDAPERCSMVSYCMAGNFEVEGPTTMQVEDFREFIKEIKEVWPNIKVVQHKDVQANRKCAALTEEELNDIVKPKSKDEEIEQLKKQVKQLIALVQKLIKELMS